MSARRGRLLLLLVVSALLALGVLLQLALFIHDGFEQQAQSEKYAVYIDGGSSGTRVRVFRYSPARWPSYVVLALPEPSFSIEPGLSAYAMVPDKAAEGVAQLLEFAYKHVPPELLPVTPVRLLATAGLRLLSKDHQAAILVVCQEELARSRFLFEPAWATVINGEMEGLYGWAGVNYITGALQEAASHEHHSRKEMLDPSQLFTGLMEMGGASMQVTFLPPATAKVLSKHGSQLHLPGVPSRLYTHSYLGLGMDAALVRAAEYLIKLQPRSPVVADPCLPIGYISEDGRHGNGSFAHCMAVVQKIMPEHNCSSVAPATSAASGRASIESYNNDPGERSALSPAASSAGGCTLQGSFMPALTGQFVAVENFAWTARALGLPDNATLRQLQENGGRYCAKHWSSLHAEFSGHIPDQFLVRYCFGAAYIMALLHSGFGLGLDDDHLLWTNNVREGGNGPEVGFNWVLGAAVVDAMNGGGAGRGRGREDIAGARGSTGSQRFWMRDEHGMAESGTAGAGVKMALLLPLAALAVVVVFVVVALLRALRGGKAAAAAVSGGASRRGSRGGSSGGAGVGLGGSGGGASDESRRTTGLQASDGGRLSGADAAWSFSSLVSEVAASRLVPASEQQHDAGVIVDPGLGTATLVGVRGHGGSQGTLGPPPHEGGMMAARHGGMFKAVAALGTAVRRNASFTSVFIGLDSGGGH